MAYDGGSVTCGCIMSRTVWPWLANAVALPGCDQAPDVAAAGAWSVLECHGQNAVLADAGLQEPQSGLAGLGCVAQVRYQVHVGIFGDPPWATGQAGELRYFCCECAGVSYPAVPLVGVPSLTCISRLRHRRPGTSAGGAEVALAAARLRKATAQPKVSSTVRPAKYAS